MGDWYPGERVTRLRASHSYGFVLALSIAAFLFMSVAPDAEWTRSILLLLETTTLIVALWTSGLGRHAVLPSVVLVCIALPIAIVQILKPSDQLAGVTNLLAVTLLLATCVVVARGIGDQTAINTQSVIGAVVIYITFGILFAFVYSAIANLDAGPLFAQGTDGTPALRLYFSYVTLATLGYGDYTMRTSLGHTLSVVEALVGQLYLVTVVAVLVSRFGRPARSGPEDEG